jgi:hypothetical protein
LDDIVKQLPEWDGRVCSLLVTNATPRTMEIRALVSAEDSSQAWTLRCKVREQLIAFLQEEHPDCLPRVRTTIESSDGTVFPTRS